MRAAARAIASPFLFLRPRRVAAKGSDRFIDKFRFVLRQDWMGMAAVVYLAMLVVVAVVGPLVLRDVATDARFDLRFVPPGTGHGWEYLLGSDALGRSFLARLVVAARTTLLIGISVVIVRSPLSTENGSQALVEPSLFESPRYSAWKA